MIDFSTHTFPNGLRLVHHRDVGSRFAVVNTLYNVGASHDYHNHRGIAHLMEHLMFSGTPEINDFDDVLQSAGGQSNAWTSSDFTNYYDIIPLHNLDTALFLEADRMRGISFSKDSLEVQKKVVCEEFKETVFNAPYGDLFHIMLNHAFPDERHPYHTPVIGDNLKEIETITTDDIKRFFFSNYVPNNAVISIVADMPFDTVKERVESQFGNIAPHEIPKLSYDFTRQQFNNSINPIRIKKEAPENVIYIGYKMDGRLGKDYIVADLLSDLLSTGQSSVFMEQFVLQGKGFRSISASVWGTVHTGIFFIRGSLIDGVSFDDAKSLIDQLLKSLTHADYISTYALERTINKAESLSRLENTNQEEMAYNLAYFTMLGDTSRINNEYEAYRDITIDNVVKTADKLFFTQPPVTIYYGPDV